MIEERGSQLRAVTAQSIGIAVLLLIVAAGCATGYSGGTEIAPQARVEAIIAAPLPWIVPGGDPSTEVVISWTAREANDRRELALGTSSELLERVAVQTLGRLRRATLAGLTPGTDYFYSVDGPVGELHHFFTPDPDRGVKFVVFGDMQSMDEVSRVGNRIMSAALASVEADLYLQLGDLTEYGGNIEQWSSVLDYLGAFASRATVAPAPGNHDRYGDFGLRNFRALFPVEFASNRGGYYSFDLGTIHFLVLDNFDALFGLTMSSAQKRWAEADLSSAEALGAEWIFVFMHHTILTTATSPHDRDLQKWLMPLADRFGVDAVFFGHDHQYEHWLYEYGRDGLVFDPAHSPTGRGVHYFDSGGGGARSEIHFGLLTHPTRYSLRRWFDLDTGSWTMVRTARTHWSEDLYIDHTDDLEYGQPLDGKHYFHLPGVSSYSSDNEHFGYGYGEQTLHYIEVEIAPGDPRTCTISVRYPNGELLSGPEGRTPQRWTLTK